MPRTNPSFSHVSCAIERVLRYAKGAYTMDELIAFADYLESGSGPMVQQLLADLVSKGAVQQRSAGGTYVYILSSKDDASLEDRLLKALHQMRSWHSLKGVMVKARARGSQWEEARAILNRHVETGTVLKEVKPSSHVAYYRSATSPGSRVLEARVAIVNTLTRTGIPFQDVADSELAEEIEIQIQRVLKFLRYEPVEIVRTPHG